MTPTPLLAVRRKPALDRQDDRPFDGPKPLSTRECADYIGQDLDYVYALIREGDLKAEYIVRPGKKRGMWVVPQEAWIACLKKLKWSRIPKIG